MSKNLAICCADEMMVGRWYKIISIPRYNNCISCKVTYSCNANNVFLAHDTVYIKSTGSFTITATDIEGNVAIKVINAIEEPNITRDTITYTPTDWETFKIKVLEYGEYKKIKIPKGEYSFTVDSNELKISKGTIIDFSDSVINILHSADNTVYNVFNIVNDYSGIINANFIGNDYKNTSMSEHCCTINITDGYCCIVKNITFKNLAGFNLNIGYSSSFWNFKPDYSSGRWISSNSFAGYINPDDGTLISSEQDWCMKDSVGVLETSDNSFCIGNSDGWISTGVKIYDIAFYDKNDNFISIQENNQFFRRYYIPKNALKFRLCIHIKKNKITDINPADDTCFTRMRDGNTVSELLIKNIDYVNHASGAVSVTGRCQDIHFENIKCIGNGWKNAWNFDFEDGWNAMCNIVLSHCYLIGAVINHSVQGLSIISSILDYLNFCNSSYYPTLINCYVNQIDRGESRGVVTYINSYVGKTNNTVTGNTGDLHIFGECPAKNNVNLIKITLQNINKY